MCRTLFSSAQQTGGFGEGAILMEGLQRHVPALIKALHPVMPVVDAQIQYRKRRPQLRGSVPDSDNSVVILAGQRVCGRMVAPPEVKIQCRASCETFEMQVSLEKVWVNLI
jgi:hypothetical protein